MSSRPDLGFTRSLELLRLLKRTVAEFAQKEDHLSRELKARAFNLNKTYQDAMAGADANYSAQMAAIEEYFADQKQRLSSLYEGRRVRVSRFRTTNLQNLPALSRQAKETWLGGLQMKKYHAERKVAADLAAADDACQGFVSRLDAYRAALLKLEKRAKGSFRGYWTFRRLLRARLTGSPNAPEAADPFRELDSRFQVVGTQLGDFRGFSLPRLFSLLPLPVLFLLVLAGNGISIWHFGIHSLPCLAIGGVSLVVLGAACFFHHRSFIRYKPATAAIAAAITESRGIIGANSARVPALTAQHEQDRRRIQEEHDRTMAEIEQQWARADEVEASFAKGIRRKTDVQAPRIIEKIDQILPVKLQALQADKAARIDWFTNETATYKQQTASAHESQAARLTTDETTLWDKLEADWKLAIIPLYQEIDTMNAGASALFPPWDMSYVDAWTPPSQFALATKFGHLDLDLSRQPAAIPKNPRLGLPGPANVSIPAALSYPYQGSLLFETNTSGAAAVIGTLNNIVLRLLSTTPPGKLSFTIIDPIGLGQSFAGLMYLGDYQENLINRRIWTQRDQIEERLAELSQHIEKVIQMYLRNEYATITEYNEKAGSVAEKYHFLVVADFPANFSETAAKRLQSIAMSGARCGIFTLIHWDQRQPLPDGFAPDELRKSSVCIRRAGNDFVMGKEYADIGASLVLEPPPEANLAVSLVHKIGKASVDSNRVEVPFVQVAPREGEEWTGDTTNEVRIAVGRTGATKLQYLAMGKGTRQHALFAGKTGSGKSTLFHVIITNLALTCSPEQVEFYLIDFKKGVEFKCYATKHLPHARVVAIESDREFALSVLQRVDEELRRRGDIFRKLGVQDIPGYKRAGGAEPMPRTLLIIDEFQEFFVEDDTIAQTASLLFDRIVRQGRAFGIHVLLGSQTLGGAYSLARATLGQMVIRVALQCNEADSYLIMDENNPAPRLLSRPGEGIYNDAAGAMEGNSPFQVVWLPDDERDLWLDKVEALAQRHPDRHYPSPIVFEGNAPADIRENDLLRTVLDTVPALPPAAGHCWFGAPNLIKGPTEITFQRQSGNHLLIVGQHDETQLNLLGLSMLALAAQYPRETAKFVFLQSTTPGSSEASFIDQIVKIIPHEVMVAQSQGVASAMNALALDLKNRIANESQSSEAPAIFLCIHGLQRFKKLRHEDDFNFSSGSAENGPDPGEQFSQIITEGSGHGIHILTTVDTLNSVNHFMNRKALSEFEMRIVFQMSANDSASLIDSPRASNLGLHRALYYNEREGYLETFRPYASPDPEWLRQTAEKLARR